MAERNPDLAVPVALGPRLAPAFALEAWSRLLRFVRREPLTAACAFIFVAIVIVAIFAPWIATHDPLAGDPRARLQGPSADHFFGTDAIGRDVFSRVVYGARVSLLVGVAATLAGTVIGAIIGLITGYLGGTVDLLVQRVMDGIQAIPALVFLLLVAAIWQQGMLSVVVVLAVLIAPYVSRLVRGVVLSLREEAFVLAAQAMGARPLRIMMVHILPNTLAPVLVAASIIAGGAMLAEGALSFLGLGIPPDDPLWKTSWGAMLKPENLQYFERSPYLVLFPGAALALTVLAVNVLGDSARDRLDPRLRGTL
ncbi:Glutathione transport system permease protein GsiD [bacterium HR24]|nr:Glutathione transport system permease protein GsiD [bacterium HR24]